MLKSYEVIYFDMVVHDQTSSGRSTYWTPLIFVLVFVTLKGKKGIMYSLFLWTIPTTIAIFYWSELLPDTKETLIQYLLSCIVYIIFLFFARHIIIAYTETEMLEKLAFQDSLTNIANRRKVYQWLEETFEKNKTISVIFFDLDRFKKINDELGHVVGDKVLLELTSLVKNYLGHKDNFGRWGGEEFIIISDHDKKKARVLAEQLRMSIANHHFSEVGQVTSSFGVEISQKGDTAETLMKRVDQALYMAKQEGRNQVKSMP
ncbi:GGDEF domain-containing protein [Aquibacillus koreensis]|nr:GGDEF domain-containing protein [Aquibacillus koreensis]